MLRFNFNSTLILTLPGSDFNTSYVTVQLIISIPLMLMFTFSRPLVLIFACSYFNTSYVTVQRFISFF